MSRRTPRTPLLLLPLVLLLIAGALHGQEAERPDPRQEPTAPETGASDDPARPASSPQASPESGPESSQTEEDDTPDVDYESLEQGARVQDPRFSVAPSRPGTGALPGGDRVDLGEPARTTAEGPLFPLRPIVERLGGKLVEFEESVTLVLADTEVIVGPGNPVMILGREIVRLSQAPVHAEPGADRVRQGLLVPLDFLRQSYGRLTDYELGWSPEDGGLTAVRRRPRTLPVVVDVVHLQGVSTVVLQFPERLEYRLVEREEDVEVRPLRDRLEPAEGGQPVRDPLVRDVRITQDRVRLDLVAGASAESYTLQDPFRLVFDVVRGEDERAEAPAEPSAADGSPFRTPPGGAVPGSVPPRGPEPPRPTEGLETVVIDPGHGGDESGAVGPSGLREKDLTLEIARTLRARLRQRLPVKVVLTRDDDSYLPLDTRSAIANQNKADLFVSIHLNSSMGHEARGAETYFLSMEASDSRAAQTAALENSAGEGADDEALYDLQLILWDLAQSYHLSASQRVASLIQQELNGALGLRDRGVKQAPFRVLMGAAMPAVLVELGFLSNPDEEAKLRDPRYRADLVDALVRAISRFRAEVTRSAGRLAPAAEPAQEAAGAPASGDGAP